MIQEVRDLYELLRAVHGSIDKMVENLTDEQWLKKPLPNFNNIASIVDHITRVEQKFFSAIAGETAEINTSEPFQVDNWHLDAIREQWVESLSYAERVLESVKEDDLSKPGLKVGMGDLNRRQLIINTIAHTAHHRGQIPLIKKLLVSYMNRN
ncbi:DinB family protein [Alicyclobacillus suci]|uniref:DinB family protein n=1 Tax=Alicyclobacillus suci TaxID=2816080 RepID=UPI001A9073A5|nr:DinB family protein [Alicyclobacillus suci]